MPPRPASSSPLKLGVVKKRADFLRLRNPDRQGGGRIGRPAFLLLYAPTPRQDAPTPSQGCQQQNPQPQIDQPQTGQLQTGQLQDSKGMAADIRVGYTVTRKLGSAVTRNRIRRRLRAVVRDVLPTDGMAGYDYVLIARPQAETRPFREICAELKSALVSLGVSRQKAGCHRSRNTGLSTTEGPEATEGLPATGGLPAAKG